MGERLLQPPMGRRLFARVEVDVMVDLEPALYRLEAAGMVAVVREESQQGRRGAPRRIYGLTTKGKRQLAKGRAEWVNFAQTVGLIIGATA